MSSATSSSGFSFVKFFRYLHASVSFRTSEEPNYSYFLLSALHIACSRVLVNRSTDRFGDETAGYDVSSAGYGCHQPHRNMNSWISILSVICLPFLLPDFSTWRVHGSDPWETCKLISNSRLFDRLTYFQWEAHSTIVHQLTISHQKNWIPPVRPNVDNRWLF